MSLLHWICKRKYFLPISQLAACGKASNDSPKEAWCIQGK